MAFAPNDNSLSSDQDANWFLVKARIKPQISYSTIRSLSTLNQNYKWDTKIKFTNEYCFNLHYYGVFIDQFYVVRIPPYVHIKVEEQNWIPTKNIEDKFEGIKIYDQ